MAYTNDTTSLTEQDVAYALQEILEYGTPSYESDLGEGLLVQRFDELGLLTSNEGIGIRLADGSEFQLTIVKSR